MRIPWVETELAAILYVNDVVDGSGRFYTRGLTGELLSVRLDTQGSVSAMAEAESACAHQRNTLEEIHHGS